MNKYQDALNNICDYINKDICETCREYERCKSYGDFHCSFKKEKEENCRALQELIKNYTELQKAYTVACRELAASDKTRKIVLHGSDYIDYKEYIIELIQEEQK